MSSTCSISGCDRPVEARGWCNRHYLRWYAHGSPEVVRRGQWGTPEERFWRYVDRSGPDGCWTWTGMTNRGYGMFRLRPGEPLMRAHRAAWTILVGPIPAGKHVLHRCNRKECVNPAHLYIGSHRQNMADAVAAGVMGGARRVKFSDATVAEMRRRVTAGEAVAAVAVDLGISRSHAYAIVRGDTRQAITD